jgi:ParB-like chromosome segregation protein Spo0J
MTKIQLNTINKELKKIEKLELSEKIEIINKIKQELHKYSPFKDNPVDTVLWVKEEKVMANDYNPNKVAPPEMKLLEHSIREDGFTQPIVTWINSDKKHEVVDGFHRNRVGKEIKDIKEKLNGYLPVVVIREKSIDRGDRISSTIRHNRARGKHTIDGMAEIVIELKRRNWSDQKIAKNLGMDPDEILRLSQITGLAEMFKDKEFSKAWEVDQINEDDSLEVTNENISQS